METVSGKNITVTTKDSNVPEWEKEFDNKFVNRLLSTQSDVTIEVWKSKGVVGIYTDPIDVKAFIALVEAKTLERAAEVVESKLEHFASIEHERWSKWQKYMHSRLYKLGDSELSINSHLRVLPTELYDRWERQINTPYSELSEKEKESDREQVRPYISDIAKAIESLGKK